MRKHIAAVSVVALAALLGLGAIAGAASLITPTKVSAGVRPGHRNKAPYKYTIKGTVQLPPLICPAGATNPAYCSAPPANACSAGGEVAIGVALGKNPYLADAGKLVDAATTKLKRDCTYVETITIPESEFTTDQTIKHRKKNGHVRVYFGVRFQGNAVIAAASAKDQAARGKVLSTASS